MAFHSCCERVTGTITHTIYIRYAGGPCASLPHDKKPRLTSRVGSVFESVLTFWS